MIQGCWAAGLFPGLEVAPVGDHRREERVAEPVLGVLYAEEVSARADLGDRLDRQAGVVDDDRVEEGSDHLQQVGVDDHLLVRRAQTALQPAGAVHHDVGASHHRAPEREDTLVARLAVDRVGGADVGRAVGHPDPPGELTTHQRSLHELGSPERRRARLHVDVRCEAAVDDGSSRVHQLGERDAGQGLGVLLDERTGDGDRCHRPGQGEGRDDDRLVAGRVLQDAFEHRLVVAQRRARIDDGVHRRLPIQGCVVDLAGDAHHLQAVDVALSPEAVDVRDLVAEREQRAGGVQVPDRGVDVGRLDGVSAEDVHRVEGLRQPDQVVEVLTVSLAAAMGEVADERRARHRGERDRVLTDVDVMVGVARVQGEVRGSGGRQRADQLRVDAHSVPVEVRARVRPQPSGGRVQEVDAGLGENAQRRGVDRLQLVLRDRPDRFHRATQPAPRRLGRRDRSPLAMAATASLGPATTLGSGFGTRGVLGQDALPDERRLGAGEDWKRLEPVRDTQAREIRAARSRRDASMLSVFFALGNRYDGP